MTGSWTSILRDCKLPNDTHLPRFQCAGNLKGFFGNRQSYEHWVSSICISRALAHSVIIFGPVTITKSIIRMLLVRKHFYSQRTRPSFFIKLYLSTLSAPNDAQRLPACSLDYSPITTSATSHFQCYPSFPSLYWLCLLYCAYGRLNLPRGYHTRQDHHQRALSQEIWEIYRRHMYGENIVNGRSSMVRSKVYTTPMHICWTFIKRQYLVLADLWPANDHPQLIGGCSRAPWKALWILFFSAGGSYVWTVGDFVSRFWLVSVDSHCSMEFSSVTTLRAYGPEWRTHRKVFQQAFKPDSCLEYRPIQTKKVHDMLNWLLQTPEGFAAHIRR